MSVSLVKITCATHIFTAGWNLPGCLPESEPATFATLDAAREFIADEIDRAAESRAEQENYDARDIPEVDQIDQYAVIYAESLSMQATASYLRADRDGDIEWGTRLLGGTFATIEADGYAYWVARATIGEVYGIDTESDEYLTLIDDLLSV